MDGGLVGTTIADPWMYGFIVVASLLGFGFRALIKGDLRTGREVDAKDARITYLEQALRTRDDSAAIALEALPSIAHVLAELHPSKAVEQS